MVEKGCVEDIQTTTGVRKRLRKRSGRRNKNEVEKPPTIYITHSAISLITMYLSAVCGGTWIEVRSLNKDHISYYCWLKLVLLLSCSVRRRQIICMTKSSDGEYK